MPALPVDVGPASPPPPRKDRPKWLGRTIPVLALLVAVGVGVLVGALALQRDPTGTDEYKSLQAELATSQDELATSQDDLGSARGEVGRAQGLAREAEASASAAVAEADARQAALDEREAAVAEREQAVTEVENQIAANSVGEGTWTVGVDIEPGTYRTQQPVGADCYWEITTSGTNGSDIIENDIPGGGIPTVTLSAGQDFTNHRCGTFQKQ